jgi:tRNA nucleotidyltransferase (CCA-adding enzyme)
MGIRGRGRTREEAFEQAALALVSVAVDPDSVAVHEGVHVVCSAMDDDLLLLDWLAAVVYHMAARRMIFRDFKVRIEGQRLEGELLGESLDLARHQPAVEVKAPTASALQVAQLDDDSWLAQCVVDV